MARTTRGSRSPKTPPDSLDSRQTQLLDLISEGEIEGLVDGNKSIFLNQTQLQADNGEFNFEDVTVYTRNGTQAQTTFQSCLNGKRASDQSSCAF